LYVSCGDLIISDGCSLSSWRSNPQNAEMGLVQQLTG
jgi:hypothetical protein